jgi:NAD(P)-dependent dehydrogenase (short-subunit alcohol dehydrogenase family)
MENKKLFDLDGRVVVVTGGLGQLGRQYTLALCAHGARVAVLDLAEEAAVGDRLAALPPDRVLYLQADICDPLSLRQGLARVEARWESPWGLINNAALDSPPNAPETENGPFETFPLDSWQRVMAVNATGAFLCCQVFGGRMAEHGRGSIVNVSSTYGVVSPDQRLYEHRRRDGGTFFKPVAYSASKSALLNLTRYLATYWGPRGVRVNTLVLGGVFNHQAPEFLEAYCAKTPLGRMAREDEYNGAVVFCLSDASSYMTGAILFLDGGWTAW